PCSRSLTTAGSYKDSFKIGLIEALDFDLLPGQQCCGRQYQPTATRASSDMRSGDHGGSNTMLTSTSEMPSTVLTAFCTQPGISPATGQPGAVSVMSIFTTRSSSISTL